jgi:hypothetical protein
VHDIKHVALKNNPEMHHDLLSPAMLPTSLFPPVLLLFRVNQRKWLSMNNLRARLTVCNQGQSGPVKPDQGIFSITITGLLSLHDHTILLGIR